MYTTICVIRCTEAVNIGSLGNTAKAICIYTYIASGNNLVYLTAGFNVTSCLSLEYAMSSGFLAGFELWIAPLWVLCLGALNSALAVAE